MNALTDSPAKAAHRVPAHATAKFNWLLRREYWENRGGFFWAPLVTGAIFLGLFAVLAVVGSIATRHSAGHGGFVIDEADPRHLAQTLGSVGNGMLLAGVVLACTVLAFVVFFYALGSLYDDRRDRSVLFWKSLPLSDSQMVLSKAAWALVLAPLWAVGVGLLIGVGLWVVGALTVTVNGLPAAGALFTHSDPLRVIGGVLASLPVHMLWALPTVGWLMFCSAWARSKPFLWAVLLPLLVCVVVSMTSILPGVDVPHDQVWYTLVYRGLLSVVPGSWIPMVPGGIVAVGDLGAQASGTALDTLDLSRSWRAFATADLWIGAAVGAAFIAAAIRLRRWRDEAA